MTALLSHLVLHLILRILRCVTFFQTNIFTIVQLKGENLKWYLLKLIVFYACKMSILALWDESKSMFNTKQSLSYRTKMVTAMTAHLVMRVTLTVTTVISHKVGTNTGLAATLIAGKREVRFQTHFSKLEQSQPRILCSKNLFANSQVIINLKTTPSLSLKVTKFLFSNF